MQFQLSLRIADRLYQELLVLGEPLDALRAAQTLLEAPTAANLPPQVLDTLVREDRRFSWADQAQGLIGLSSWQDGDPDLSAVAFVALDLETTGAKAGPGKITEIGAVRIEGLQVTREFHTLVNPQRPIPPMITHITGITEAMVADAPRIEDALPDLLILLEGAIVVAHNAPFDVGFLNYELHRLQGVRLGEGAVDTLTLSRALLPGLTNYKLKTVADSLGSPVIACHRALADAQAVAHVFIHLAGVLRENGVCSLKGLRKCGHTTASSGLQKLPLTRDLPERPGVYTFVDQADRVLLAGSADSLAPTVRALFTEHGKSHRGLRSAIRLVERIDHQETCSPLEALVQEHELLLEHRPSHNAHRTCPESYPYVRASGGPVGLLLSTTRSAPRWLADLGSARPATGAFVLGPFRRRAAARAAVELLQSCYPIRRCPRSVGDRPCARASSGECFSTCSGAPEARAANDRLVTDLIFWIAGHSLPGDRPDPLQRAVGLASEQARSGAAEEAGMTTERCEHLVAIRRAYANLAEARELCFACVWPQDADGGRSARLNLVVDGMLRFSTFLWLDDLDRQVAVAFDATSHKTERRAAEKTDGERTLVAVRQEDLDCLLSIRRWYREQDVKRQPRTSLVSWQSTDLGSLERARDQIVSATRLLLER